MTNQTHAALAAHLIRTDRQEDICIATYSVSTGAHRTTYLLNDVVLPETGDREVHGNATIFGAYVLRAASHAAAIGRGIIILHSHPAGRGWEPLSSHDSDAEASYSSLAEQLTGLPLIGMTLAGRNLGWSARVWNERTPGWAISVRVVGPTLDVTWNTNLVPTPEPRQTQIRTISAWGGIAQEDLARLRVLVVGVGSVGLDIVQRLAATGIERLGVMDTDIVEPKNLDRLIGATRLDARLRRPKIKVAARLAKRAATAKNFRVTAHNINICSVEGRAVALDYDVIFSCVDKPWPRAILSTIAYSDLIPVIDGGIDLEAHPAGGIFRGSARFQTLIPGNPCLVCSKQISANDVTLEMGGLLDDPHYIAESGRTVTDGGANVAALSATVSAGQLEQFVALTTSKNTGVSLPVRHIFTTLTRSFLQDACAPYCTYENRTAHGDRRADLGKVLSARAR